MTIIKAFIYRSRFLSTILAFLFEILFFLKNKRKIEIYFKDNFWIHVSPLGKFAYMHPVRSVEYHLLFLLPWHLKQYIPKLDDVIFDVGAGIGNDTIYMSKLVGKNGKVFAIEANPKIYSHLLETIRINELKNVIPLNIAIYDDSKKSVNFSSSEFNWLTGGIDEGGDVMVKTKTLDQLLLDFNLIKVDFAKFNIEGAEKYLITGGRNFNNICQNYSISCHDFLGDPDCKTHDDIYNFLKNSSFKILKGNRTSVDYLDSYIYATKNMLLNNDSLELDQYDYNNYHDHISKFFEKNL